MNKKIHVYHVTLTNGELLENIRIKGSLEWNFSGITATLVVVEDTEGKSIALSKYHIVKAELVSIED